MAPPLNVDVVSAFTTVHHDTYPYIAPSNIDLSGKSVFIAGASKGIGRLTSLTLAKAGCSKIAVGSRSSLADLEKEITEAAIAAGKTAPLVVSVELDVTLEESVKAAAEKIGEAFGGSLDVLIANAGNMEEWKPVGETVVAEWWKTWETNFKGPYLLNRYFISLLLKSEIKTSILTSSYGALCTMPGASGYQGSKFAVSRLAEFIADEYVSQGLVCYSIHPGAVKTDLAFGMPDYMWRVLVDEPALAADTFVWLCKERRPWLSGRFLSVNWDMEELEAKKEKMVEDDLCKFRLTV
ncbi:hypothetical protein GGR50DRAFT_126350 [Xylaria sp. CBS 124048]|nr:hypothetical protein GGR50DRAFT_126350 [Xylaria sp. CBS 124048]